MQPNVIILFVVNEMRHLCSKTFLICHTYFFCLWRYFFIFLYIRLFFRTTATAMGMRHQSSLYQSGEELSTQYTLHSTQYTLNITQYTVHSTQYTVHSTQYKVHSTQYIVHSAQYTVYSHTWKKKLVYTAKVWAKIHLPQKQRINLPKKCLIYKTNSSELLNFQKKCKKMP